MHCLDDGWVGVLQLTDVGRGSIDIFSHLVQYIPQMIGMQWETLLKLMGHFLASLHEDRTHLIDEVYLGNDRSSKVVAHNRHSPETHQCLHRL
jgi:hypothetical protein